MRYKDLRTSIKLCNFMILFFNIQSLSFVMIYFIRIIRVPNLHLFIFYKLLFLLLECLSWSKMTKEKYRECNEAKE